MYQAGVTAKRPVTTEHHGIAITDNYGWLRADNWQDVMRDPAVLDRTCGRDQRMLRGMAGSRS